MDAQFPSHAGYKAGLGWSRGGGLGGWLGDSSQLLSHGAGQRTSGAGERCDIGGEEIFNA